MIRRRERGTTLLELLVYSLLLGILLLAVYGVLSAGMKYFRFIEAISDVRGQAQSAMLRVAADVSESRGYTVVRTSSGITFASPRDKTGRFTYDAYGNLQWHRFVSYYVDSQRRLLRRVIYLSAPTSTPTTPTSTMISTTTVGAEVIAENVTTLTFNLEPSGSPSPTSVRLAGRFERSGQGANDNRIDVTTTVQMQN